MRQKNKTYLCWIIKDENQVIQIEKAFFEIDLIYKTVLLPKNFNIIIEFYFFKSIFKSGQLSMKIQDIITLRLKELV